MDTSKLATATARAMDEIDKFTESGDISADAYVGAVCIVVAIDSKTKDDVEDRDLMRDVATQTFVFVEPQEIYIQEGLLRLGIRNYGAGSDE